jgi:hypothetical protein
MMTNDGSRAVRWLVIIALSVATAGMFLVSMRANYLYGRSIGQSAETREALAWANVGADVWKGFGLIVVAALWRNRERRAVVCEHELLQAFMPAPVVADGWNHQRGGARCCVLFDGDRDPARIGKRRVSIDAEL